MVEPVPVPPDLVEYHDILPCHLCDTSAIGYFVSPLLKMSGQIRDNSSALNKWEEAEPELNDRLYQLSPPSISRPDVTTNSDKGQNSAEFRQKIHHPSQAAQAIVSFDNAFFNDNLAKTAQDTNRSSFGEALNKRDHQDVRDSNQFREPILPKLTDNTRVVERPARVRRHRPPPKRMGVDTQTSDRAIAKGTPSPIEASENPKRTEISNRIREWLLQWLQECFKSCGPGQVASTGNCRCPVPENTGGDSQTSEGGRKRARKGDDGDYSDGDSDEDDSRPKKRATARKASRRFACPFFKNNPRNHGLYQSCSGPGFTDVHRLK